jgi:hypothetical protein
LHTCEPIFRAEGTAGPRVPVDREGTDLGVEDTQTDRTVRIGSAEGRISPDLMGVSLTYHESPDDLWAETPITDLLYRMGVSFIRYPGGGVSNNFHWQNPRGSGFQDPWDPDFSDYGTTKPASTWMSVDEYYSSLVAACGKPLMGINIASGIKYDRFADGLAESEALLQYVNENFDHSVEHWFIGNEIIYTDITPEEYADSINRYVPALREIQDDLTVIANWGKSFDDNTETLVTQAGDNIDVLDWHYYVYRNATFEDWRGTEPLRPPDSTKNYEELTAEFYSELERLGYPDTQVARLEWNIKPHWKDEDGTFAPSRFEAALINSDIFIQMIRGGLDMAAFWPLYWGGPWTPMELLDADRESADAPTVDVTPMYKMFRLFTSVLGHRRLATQNAPGIVTTAARQDGVTTAFVLRKNRQSATVTLNLGEHLDAEALSNAAIRVVSLAPKSGTRSEDGPANETQPWKRRGDGAAFSLPEDSAAYETRPWERRDGGIAFSLPEYRLAKVVVDER